MNAYNNNIQAEQNESEMAKVFGVVVIILVSLYSIGLFI
jgi:hypothetical protein